ncbi:MAG: hypothetical protein S0880_19855 [Actinomycetota bacterium]|nr:hypothetical protein [Actinomycetota bacterium]
MSSIWTPGGEHPVDDRRQQAPAAGVRPDSDEHGAVPPGEMPDMEDLTPEQRERLAAATDEVAEIRRQLAEAPAEVVVANHVMGLFELAAIHLGQDEPDLPSARLAIDAMAAVLDKLSGRLGEHEPSIVAARGQIQMAYVQVANQAKGGEDAGDDAIDETPAD